MHLDNITFETIKHIIEPLFPSLSSPFIVYAIAKKSFKKAIKMAKRLITIGILTFIAIMAYKIYNGQF